MVCDGVFVHAGLDHGNDLGLLSPLWTVAWVFSQPVLHWLPMRGLTPPLVRTVHARRTEIEADRAGATNRLDHGCFVHAGFDHRDYGYW